MHSKIGMVVLFETAFETIETPFCNSSRGQIICMVALSFLLIDRFIIYIVVVVGVGDIGDNSKKPRTYAAYRRKILGITCG